MVLACVDESQDRGEEGGGASTSARKAESHQGKRTGMKRNGEGARRDESKEEGRLEG
jgi:hypothetical protein